MAEYSHKSKHHLVRVADFNGVRTLRFERNQQSSMRLNDPFGTDIEYVGYLHLPVAVKPEARRALVIGLGGGTLVKQLWRDHPALHVDAVELDAEVAEIARELFELPHDPRIAVHIAEGRSFLEACDHMYDFIVVDAYDDDRMPLPLTTEQFMLTARAHMHEDGAIAYNIIGTVAGTLSKPLRRLHKTASNVWRNVWLFTVASLVQGGIDPQNVILLATDAPLAEDELLARIASRVNGSVSVPGFETFGEQLYRGKLRSGDVAILSDPGTHRR